MWGRRDLPERTPEVTVNVISNNSSLSVISSSVKEFSKFTVESTVHCELIRGRLCKDCCIQLIRLIKSWHREGEFAQLWRTQATSTWRSLRPIESLEIHSVESHEDCSCRAKENFRLFWTRSSVQITSVSQFFVWDDCERSFQDCCWWNVQITTV